MSSGLAFQFNQCRSCGVIDRDADRTEVGRPCKTCQVPQSGAIGAFHLGILLLIDLMNELNFSTPVVSQASSNEARQVGVVVFFCALREALMNWFVDGQLRALRVPDGIGVQLVSDNKLANQKFGPLFKAITCDNWNDGVEKASALAKEDFGRVSELMILAAKHRNTFLHTGDCSDVSEEMANRCFSSIKQLLSLFANLHNVYTHPIIRKNV